MSSTSNARTVKATSGNLSLVMDDTHDWTEAFNGQVTLANAGSSAVSSWTLSFDLSSNITSIWEAKIVSHSGAHYVIAGEAYNADLPPGGQVSFGFNADGGNPVLPTQFTLNGQVLSGTASTTDPDPTPTTPPSGTPKSDAGDLLPAGFLSTRGNQIVDASGKEAKIAAVNWYGMETSNFAPQGLWVRSYQSMMDQMVSLGFNAIRLPFSLEMFKAGSTPSGIDYRLNPDLAGLTGPQILDKIVAYAGMIGLRIILDNHRSAAGGGPNDNGLWYDSGYTEAQWIANWQTLAAHFAGNTTVIAADLSNEPHNGATWGDGSATDWQAAATRAGNAIQSVNPNWLILVEGVQNYQGQNTWWGGNLQGVAAHPVTLNVPNKVVYSPHDYPSSVSSQPWFSASGYPNNLPAVWDSYWGYIYKSGLAPILVGEYGSKLETASDRAWMAKLVAYMDTPSDDAGAQGVSWAYWDWNPTSGDTGGILNSDWTTVDPAKIAAITAGFYKDSSTPGADKRFAFSDVATSASGTDSGIPYSGPVNYLQYQYIWGSAHDVALRADVPNAFLKGGAGDDALAVSGGSNVLDGAAGSNFLTGGTGGDGGIDTFFLDGRGGAVTWSTVVNFHPGDQATIIGFQPGVSTLPITASDGVTGYRGVTIHSELKGAGTGVNASITFAGISAETTASHFVFSTGTLSENSSYLLIQYK
jgi:aryl-phospho-beta-D-glucosidase BglC (GH1 family)